MNQKRILKTPITATIEKFSHDGRGIARINGKTTFIEGALPGEIVEFQYKRQKRDYDEGVLLSVIEPSLNRVSPRCPHYAVCGGCSWQHLDGQAQIHEKQLLLLDLLQRVGRCQPENILEPLTGDLWHYRNKARLSVRYVEKKQSVLVGFREKNNPRYIADIHQCPILHPRVDAELMHLRALIETFDDGYSIAQIEVAAGDEDVALIFRNTSLLTASDEEKLGSFAKKTNFRIFLQPAGPDSVYLLHPKDGSSYLRYALPDEGIVLDWLPTDFTQINAGLNRRMVARALQLLMLEQQDVVLDLFCGLGNFALPMATHCQLVIGVEGSQAMVDRASMNANNNQLDNVRFLCRNLDNATLAFQEWSDLGVTKVLLDPPRTGALEVVKEMNRCNPNRIVYVSCNPATLARDAGVLVHEHGYRLVDVGVMDMFPHTAHVESMALFVKSSEA